MSDLINGMNLPWKDKPKRGALLRAIGRIGDVVQRDIHRVSRSYHPYLCEAVLLKRYGREIGIPMFEGESEEELRDRVSSAGFFLKNRGQRSQVFEVLDRIVPERYVVFEAPKDGFRVGFSKIGVGFIANGFFLAIKVRGLTVAESEKIHEILNVLLDPGIEIIVVPWIIAVPANLSFAQIRLYGGSRWLATQYTDLCDGVRVRLLPDDAFRMGDSRVGYSIIWGENEDERIRVYCRAGVRSAILERSLAMYESTINWEVINE